MCRTASPGDMVILDGVYLPVPPETRFGIGSTLLHDTYLEV